VGEELAVTRQTFVECLARRWGPIEEMGAQGIRSLPPHRTAHAQVFLAVVHSFDVPQLKITADCFLCALSVVRKAVDTFILGSDQPWQRRADAPSQSQQILQMIFLALVVAIGQR
jgi:hypothetical protein